MSAELPKFFRFIVEFGVVSYLISVMVRSGSRLI